MRIPAIVWICIMVASAFGLYKVKFEVQTIRSQIADMSHELERERESLNVVAAEWAYLNRPDRLQKLANQYLNTEEVTVQQIAEVRAIPFPQVMEASSEAPTTPSPSAIVPVAYSGVSVR